MELFINVIYVYMPIVRGIKMKLNASWAEHKNGTENLFVPEINRYHKVEIAKFILHSTRTCLETTNFLINI